MGCGTTKRKKGKQGQSNTGCRQQDTRPWKHLLMVEKEHLPLTLDLSPGKAAACNLDHFGMFFFLLTKIDAAVELFAVGSCVCSIWDGRFQIKRSVIFHIYRNNCFWKEIWAPYLTLQMSMQHHTAFRPQPLSTTPKCQRSGSKPLRKVLSQTPWPAAFWATCAQV